VTQSCASRGLLLILSLITTSLWGQGIDSMRPARAQSETSAKSAVPPQQLSPEGQASSRAIIGAGNLSVLRWPDFSDYAKHVQKFYESYGYSWPWVKGMAPTAQAKQTIAFLSNADQKGLSAEDYDGTRWSERLGKLKPGVPQPSEADAAPAWPGAGWKNWRANLGRSERASQQPGAADATDSRALAVVTRCLSEVSHRRD